MRRRDDHRGGPGPEPRRAADVIAESLRGAGPGEAPVRLCRVAVDLLPVAGASVSLHNDGMPVQLGATGPRAAYVTEIQATLGDGPCQWAARSRAPVLAGDLTAGRDVARWPVFAQLATAAGVRAVYSLPLGDAQVCVGTLDLYGDTPGELSGRDLRTARLVAGMLTLALMALPHTPDGQGEEVWLGGLAADHDPLYQATGMIVAQLCVGTDEALARLRAHAFAQGRTALDVSQDVVAHRLRFDTE
ncbi:GAF and ANTAR domain-containing protein [Streptomyces sp. NPDC056628]|uniref:GAF and ANTAR domain-containing protein n=1 Tax=Streptomyces sp. NPDC056628 TaxID=3345882 RepID=UPI0036B07DCD